MADFLNNISNRVGSTINNITGNIIGNITGLPSEDIPLYERFLYDILSDADNAITEPSYWVVFFTKGSETTDANETIVSSISSMIKDAIGSYISQFNIANRNPLGDLSPDGLKKTTSYKIAKSGNPMEVVSWRMTEKGIGAEKQFWEDAQRTIMLVQGIELPGDGFGIERQGAEQIGGFLRPPLTQMRNDLPELEITFLENNTSVTDLVIRPWVIEASYASLKFAKNCTITCYNLTRSPSGFRVRKKFNFYNAVPISVDSEKYEYSAGTSYGKRQVKFVYTHYTVEDGDPMRDSLVGSIANTVLQTTRRFISGVVESGVDVVTGTANQIVTNVTGAFTDTVNDHLQDVQSRVREYAKDAEASIIDNSQRAIDKAIGFDPAKDSLQGPGTEFSTAGVDNNPSPRLEVRTDAEDKLASPPVPPKSSFVSNNVRYTIKKINTDDTPDTGALKTQEVTINNNREGINTTSVTTPSDDNIRR